LRGVRASGLTVQPGAQVDESTGRPGVRVNVGWSGQGVAAGPSPGFRADAGGAERDIREFWFRSRGHLSKLN
jgi:hypothetical protein